MLNVQQLLGAVEIPAMILCRSAECGKFIDDAGNERFWARLNGLDVEVAKKATEAGLDLENLTTFIVKLRNPGSSFDFTTLENKVIKIPAAAEIVPIIKNGRLEDLALSIDFVEMEVLQ
ncbi:TPA: hypothetical protein ACGO3Z_001874 [Streptococcus suis]